MRRLKSACRPEAGGQAVLIVTAVRASPSGSTVKVVRMPPSRIGLGEHAAGLGFGDAHVHRLRAAVDERVHVDARSRAAAPFAHLQPFEVGFGQDVRVVILVVGDDLVDKGGGGVDRA